MGGLVRIDKAYKPLMTFVLDPLELTAMGVQVQKKMNGDQRWERMKAAKWAHPDAQKLYCVAYGALIYVHPFPERSAKDMRPPRDWLTEAGITEATLHEAAGFLDLHASGYMKKREIRQSVIEAMDGDYS